jgi:hypothetical protein
MEPAGFILKWGKILVIIMGFTNASRLVLLLERAYAYFCTLLQCFTPLLKYMIFTNLPGMFPNFSNARASIFFFVFRSNKLNHASSFT